MKIDYEVCYVSKKITRYDHIVTCAKKKRNPYVTTDTESVGHFFCSAMDAGDLVVHGAQIAST
jgi:hypothetical protein